MRKMKIGIFALATVIIFFLSTSVSVTAATHQDTYMIMTSNVYEEQPWANVYVEPQEAGGTYCNWVWTIDIDNGDDIIIDTTCEWFNSVIYTPPPSSYTGYHYFYVEATYEKGLDIRNDYEYNEENTYGIPGSGPPEEGDTTINVGFYDIEEGGIIYLYWYVSATNLEQSPPVFDEFDHTGTVRLT